MRSLLYLYDPLCGWCYAATPAIAALRNAGVDVALKPTGLFSNPENVMTRDFAEYAWGNDQRIATLTGQTFTETYRRHVLGATGTAFDSSTATLALTAVSLDEPAREADALRALQEARYIAGRDITGVATVCSILAEAGFSAAANALEAPSAALLSANAVRVTAGKATVRAFGASGVPTLVLIDGAEQRLLDDDILYGAPDALLQLFDVQSAARR